MWIEVEDLAHAYEGHRVLDGLGFRLERGRIGCLLGPSGCGKTTALRCLAGFEPIERGRIVADDVTLSVPGAVLPPERREIGMVFQDYALFPHLTVRENVAFGVTDGSADERRALVERVLGIVDLGDAAGLYPHQLSGGQQQRVALARALAPRPRLLLLDAPFSNLDPSMRVELGAGLREILKRLEMTALLVTHDQQEAFAIADEIGVMNAGRLEQWATPYALYREPATPFVAGFVGEGTLVPGTVTADGMLETELGRVTGRVVVSGAGSQAQVSAVDVLFRASDLQLDDESTLQGRIAARAFRGADVLYRVELPSGCRVKLLAPGFEDHKIGQRIGLSVAATRLVAFPSAASVRESDRGQ